jgi:hypothetical protein
MVTNDCTRVTQRYNFSVRGRIVLAQVLVPSGRNHAAVTDHNGSHRHLAGFERPLRGPQSLLHVKFIRAVAGLVVGRQSSVVSQGRSHR